MSKCYIPEISIKSIRSNIVDDLKNNFNFVHKIKNMICAPDGFYEVNESSITKFVTVISNEIIFENFIDKYTLLVSTEYDKKINDTEFIPYESENITIEYFLFDIPESNNKFVLEFIKNRCHDFYFKTQEKVRQNNIFLNNDVSLILKTLNV